MTFFKAFSSVTGSGTASGVVLSLSPISLRGPRDLRGSFSTGQDRYVCVCVCVCVCICVCVCVCLGLRELAQANLQRLSANMIFAVLTERWGNASMPPKKTVLWCFLIKHVSTNRGN